MVDRGVSQQSLLLNSGYRIPQLGFGTFDVIRPAFIDCELSAAKEVVTNAVELALSAGYRHVDCAMIYDNEAEIGKGLVAAMRNLKLEREDIFVTSKLWCDNHAPEDVHKACELSVKRLGLEYLDLYLVHFPASFRSKEDKLFDPFDSNSVVFEYHRLEDTWKAMEELVSTGLVKSIGVSNFNKRQMERILASCTIPPAVNQVEVNINWLNTKLIEFCHSRNIVVEGYSPLGSPGFLSRSMYVDTTDLHNVCASGVKWYHLHDSCRGKMKSLLEEEAVFEIALKHRKTPAQVLLRHGLQRGIVVLVKSVTPERIKTNFDVFDFELTDEEVDRLNKAGSNERLVVVPALKGHPDYPFDDEF
uniref:Aldo_ket_red domain-containing protein n=1 Tax=Hydatigena taeniaeformis TaxID=6205 RepID=A0A0R3WMU3_HYDTA